MRGLIIFSLCFWFRLALGQGTYSIEGRVPDTMNGHWIYLCYWEKREQRFHAHVDSSLIQSNHFSFKGHVAIPALGGLWLDKNPVLLSEWDTVDTVPFYIEPGQMSVETQDILKNLKISGSKLNEDFLILQAMKKSNDAAMAAFRKERADTPHEVAETKEVTDDFERRERALIEEHENIRLSFAEQNPRSLLRPAAIEIVGKGGGTWETHC